jgi:hypothetical protein
MADQAQLDLELPTTAPIAASARKEASSGGFTRLQILAGAAALLLMIWAMWLTNAIVTHKQGTIVAARLSGIVGDYVEAQRFSGSPPERVKLEMQTFMASLDKELQRRSAAGEIVLVGEAVLTRSVPDITDDLKKAIYASGVPQPRRASVKELQPIQQQAWLGPAGGSPAAAPPAAAGTSIDPMAAATSTPRQQFAPAATSVTTFGGPNGSDGQ